jgi:hypothetical protein
MSDSIDFRLTDARVILSKWCAEETRLLCLANFFNLVFTLRGTVSFISNEEFVMVPSSGEAKLTFRLDDPELVFTYAERRELPDAGVLDEEFASSPALSIALPARVSMRWPLPDVPPKRETIKFIEA